ncbi:mitochondrial carrier domain-containing protein [Flagelloscypha sp. PMI_526]|nr:mitochondrial carrier domain-containing protein [Flagelloscypha sp. PMI_526]
MDGFFRSNDFNDTLRRHKAVVCAVTASYVSTFAGYPLDSLKSRLQTQKTPISVPKLAANVYREEGVKGFYRGLWVPLFTISFVRATSFTIYNKSKDWMRYHQWCMGANLTDVAFTGGIAGAASGAVICFGAGPFELVKIRRQLEYSIAASRGIISEIYRLHGVRGFWMGLPLHFYRDTLGTALYFLEYDGMRFMMGRSREGTQDQKPWLPIPNALIPFFCGSFAGVTSWALIYPLDVVKTKVQQRRLAGERYRGPAETLRRLIRGPDPENPRPITAGIARIYRGLGVSAVRSITTHGLVWTVFQWVEDYINGLPQNEP